MKKFVVAALIGAGLLSWQAGSAEASSNSGVQNANVQYKVKQVHFTNWQEFQNWCNTAFKDVQGNTNKETVKKNENTEQPKPEQNVEKQPEQQQPTQQQPTQQQPAPEQTPNKPSQEANDSGLTAEEQQMLNLVNSERQKNGLQPLKANLELTKVARVKAQDMIDNNYFSHDSPTYGSPFDMMKKFGISYQTAGENLAGNQTVEKAHTALMNSEGHRANILNGNYTEVGIGIVDGGPYGKMFVQMFKG